MTHTYLHIDLSQKHCLAMQVIRMWLSIRTVLFGVMAILMALLFYYLGWHLYIYFVVYSPNHLAPPPIRTCNNCSNSTIPRLLHQTWKTKQVPQRWQLTYQSCLNKHKDYKHILWTDYSVEQFLAKEYPWFLATYHSYPYSIQRVDAARYFILYHYGGVYIDMDIGCNVSTHQILQDTQGYTVLLAEAVPTGVTNWFMASEPRHVLFRLAIDRLEASNHWYGTPHVTIMWTAGPMHLTRSASKNPYKEQVLILPLNHLFTRYFWRVPGGSWHRWDESAFIVLEKIATRLDLVFYFSILVLSALFFIMLLYCRYRRTCLMEKKPKMKYTI